MAVATLRPAFRVARFRAERIDRFRRGTGVERAIDLHGIKVFGINTEAIAGLRALRIEGAIPSWCGKGGSTESDFGQGVHVCDYTLARRAALETTRVYRTPEKRLPDVELGHYLSDNGGGLNRSSQN